MTNLAEGKGGTKLAEALRWNTGGLALQAAFQLVFALLLARLLGPATYGIIAMAWIVLGPALIIADAGLGLAMVQSPSLTGSAVRYCFCVQALLALAVTTLLAAFSPLISQFFDAPELEAVLLPLSSVVLIQAFGLASVNLLRRRLDYRRLQILQLGALIGSTLLVTLPLALLGFGIWSLVVGTLANVIVISICATTAAPIEAGVPPGLIIKPTILIAAVPAILLLGLSSAETLPATIIANAAVVAFAVRQVAARDGLRGLRRRGALGTTSQRFLLLNVVNAVIGGLPALVVGRLFGVTAVGLYDRANALIVTPFDRAAAAASNVLFSYHAELYRTGAAQADTFLSSLRVALLVGLPMATFLSINDALIVEAALGSAWLGAVPLIQPMAIAVALIFVLQTIVPVLNSRGRPEIEVVVQLVSIGVFVVLVALVARDTPVQVLWALTAAFACRVICLLCSVGFFIPLEPLRLLNAALPGMATTLLLLAADRATDAMLPLEFSGIVRLAAIVGISVAVVGPVSLGMLGRLSGGFGRRLIFGRSS